MRTKDKTKIKKLIEQRQAEILNAANRVFSRYGFAKTTIDQVAVEAGLGKGTIYQYFKSKKELFLAVGRNGMDKLKDTMIEEIEQEKDPVDRIEKAIRTYLLYFQKNTDLANIFMYEQSEFKKEIQKKYFENYYGHVNRMQETFKEAMKRALIKDMDVNNSIVVLISMLNGLVYMWQVEGMKYSLESKIPAILEIFLTGILKDEKRKKRYERS